MTRLMLAAIPTLCAWAGTPQTSIDPPVVTFEVARSANGRAITCWRIGAPEPDSLGRGPDGRPAILIVSGLDGRHDFGTRLALTLIDRLVTEHAELLTDFTVYIIPDLNPDIDALFDLPGAPRADFGRAPRPTDADGDGRSAEDPAEDLNGDGMITMMRIRNPAPGTGIPPTLVIDPEEPRTLREPDPAKAEVAEYALLVEGYDNDGDGRYNEDGFAGSAGGGVDLDRNFPSLWPEHDDGAGDYALSEPETRKLVEWMLTRDNIVCALAFVPADNILNLPDAGKFAPDGREPSGIEEEDKPAYEKVQELFKEITRQTGAPGGAWQGSFTQWAYAQFGVYSFATPAWVRPDLVKAAEEPGAGAAPEAPAQPGAEPPPPDPEAERRSLQERGIPAFIIDFLLASPEERAATVEQFNTLSPQEQGERMGAIAALPEDVQLRVRALASGQPDTAEQAGARGEGRPARSGKDEESDERKWIKYSDEHLGGRGFVPWRAHRHPQLGDVEIGGLIPGIRHEPPESEWQRLAGEQAQFVARLLGMLPRLETEVLPPERIASGVWRIRLRATNPGALPTRSGIGEKARRIPPIVVGIGLEPDTILTGTPVQRLDAIPGHGAHADVEWVVSAPDGSTLAVEVRSDVFGDRVLEVQLMEGE